MLTAAYATKVNTKFSEETKFHVARTYFWSDSKIALKYTYNKETQIPVYVMHRLDDIRIIHISSVSHICVTEK